MNIGLWLPLEGGWTRLAAVQHAESCPEVRVLANLSMTPSILERGALEFGGGLEFPTASPTVNEWRCT